MTSRIFSLFGVLYIGLQSTIKYFFVLIKYAFFKFIVLHILTHQRLSGRIRPEKSSDFLKF